MTSRRRFLQVMATLPPAFTFRKALAAPDPSRRALIVGNTAYEQAPLVNPENDARGMSRLLTDAGMQCDTLINAKRVDLLAAIERFGKAVRQSDTKLAIFYYAGHGVQLDWRNYLLPVDAVVDDESHVKSRCVDLGTLLGHFGGASEKTFVIILDACRNNPFGNAYRPPQKGLSQFDAPPGSLLAYATSPGNVAADGSGSNGLYTEHLLRELANRDTRIEDALKRVRLNVRLASRGEQIPWETTSLEGDVFIFSAGHKKLSEADLEQQLEADINAWTRIKSSKKLDDWVEYLRNFPNGRFAEIAQMRLTRLLAEVEKRNTEDRQEQVRLAQEQERARLAEEQRLAAERKQREEQARLEQERQERERERARLAEEQRLTAERKAREERERLERERVRVAEEQRLAAERRQREEQERVAREQARLAEERRLANEQKLRTEQERERARLAEEQRLAAERKLREEQERLERERLERERLRLAEEQRMATERRQREEQDRQERERARLAEEQRLADERRRREDQQAREARRKQEEEQEQARRREQDKLAQSKAAPPVNAPPSAGGILVIQAGLTVPRLIPASSNPYSAGRYPLNRTFTVGDEATFRQSDLLTGVEEWVRTQRVTRVDPDEDRVYLNDGSFVWDMMGNGIRNPQVQFDTPVQFTPAEFQVGKKWTAAFRRTQKGRTTSAYYDLQIVKRESITVPAGTFDTFRIEGQGWNMTDSVNLEVRFWLVPGLNFGIKRESLNRNRWGRIGVSERVELVALKQHVVVPA